MGILKPLLPAADRPRSPRLRRWLWGCLGAIVAVPLLGFLLLLLIFQNLWGDTDVLIPLAEARPALAELLAKRHGMTLEPTDELVEAHRTGGGMQGDGDCWYLFRLPGRRAEELEAELRAAGEHVPPRAEWAGLQNDSKRDEAAWRAPIRDQTPIDRLSPRIRQALEAPAGSAGSAVRTFYCNDRYGTQIIFTGDHLYYQFSHY